MDLIIIKPVSSWRLGLLYVSLIVIGIAALLVIQQVGSTLSVQGAAAVGAGASAHAGPHVVLYVLATLAAILALGRVMGEVCRWFQQPVVIGEVLAGIVLGPSVLGAIAPGVSQWLIPGADIDPHGQVIAALKAISQLGVVLYMFLVGTELNLRKVHGLAKPAVAISHASIVIPFVLGSMLALWLYPRLSTADVSFTSFALFLGVAMSITAFPVLARILADRKQDQTDLGVMALSCAAADDLTAWCLLAFVVGVAQAAVGGAVMVLVGALAFVVLMIAVVRPVLQWCIARWGEDVLARALLPSLLVAALMAAFATEAIGIHAVFGAFLLGSFIPHGSRIAKEIRDRLHDVVTLLLLPAFFALSGMNTQIGLLNSAEEWLICLVIIAIATAGKFGGTYLAARCSGMESRPAAILGVLMNTRGLMELIVLNIGLSLGVISPTLFTMLVVMALVTTFATGPWLTRLTSTAPPPGPVPAA